MHHNRFDDAALAETMHTRGKSRMFSRVQHMFKTSVAAASYTCVAAMWFSSSSPRTAPAGNSIASPKAAAELAELDPGKSWMMSRTSPMKSGPIG
jgi:Na+/H+ antiporter NhaC